MKQQIWIGLFVASTAMLGACTQGSAAATSDPIFSEDFESGTLKSWQDGVDPQRHHIVSDPDQAKAANRYLAVTYPAGRDGGWLTRFLPPGYDALYVSYDVRFPANWKGPTKLVALYGARTDDRWSAFGKAGLCPNGTDFFAAMLVTAAGGDPGPARFYTYYPGMAREPDGVTCWGRYGDRPGAGATYAPSLTLSHDVWHHVEFSVELNTPGQADGSQTFWVDGAEWASWPGLRFRDSAALRLNAVQLSFSVGLDGGATQTQELDVDNLLVQRTRP